jgi:hypothetical protein
LRTWPVTWRPAGEVRNSITSATSSGRPGRLTMDSSMRNARRCSESVPAKNSVVTAGAISQRVARAERAGLVTRAPGGSGRRAVEVALTDTGHALVEHTVDRVLGREADLLGMLGDDRRTQLTGLLAELLDDLTARLGPPPDQPD